MTNTAEFQIMSAANLGGIILDYVGEIDVIRIKSGRLQGALNGKMKDRLAKIKDADNPLT